MTGILCGDGCVVCGKCYNLMSTSTVRTHRFCASAALSDPVAHNHLRVQASRAFVWLEAGVNVLVRPYGVLPTEPGASIIEVH